MIIHFARPLQVTFLSALFIIVVIILSLTTLLNSLKALNIPPPVHGLYVSSLLLQ